MHNPTNLRSVLVALLLLLTAPFSIAQDYDFGKVSKAEVQETEFAINPDVDARYLFRNVEVSYDLTAETPIRVTEVHERIKIYNEDGYNYATQSVVTYEDVNVKEQIRGLKGYTYNMEGNKLKKEKLKGSGKFSEKINEERTREKWIMPNVKDGSVIEYTYRIESNLLASMDRIDVQEDIPIARMKVKVSIPEFFEITPLDNPTANYKFQMAGEQRTKRISSTNTVTSGGIAARSKTSNTSFAYQVNDYTADIQNVPGLADESMVSNRERYRAFIDWKLDAIKMPGSARRPMNLTWDDLVYRVYDNQNFGPQLGRQGAFKDEIAQYAELPDEQKIAAAFQFVQSKVSNNGYIGVFAYNGVRKAYREGSGNVADINLMLVSALNELGVQSYPVLVSTRSNGVPHYPSQSSFNYVIAAAQLNGGYVLMDASDPYSLPNMLPEHVRNVRGRLISPNKNSEWISLEGGLASQAQSMQEIAVSETGVMSGSYKERSTDMLAHERRMAIAPRDKQEVMEALENNYDVTVTNFEKEEITDLSAPYVIDFGFTGDKLTDVIDDTILIPALGLEKFENPFKAASRTLPISREYPLTERGLINITIPAGYTVESLPEQARMATPDKELEYTYSATADGDKVSIQYQLKMNAKEITAGDYTTVKMFYEQMVAHAGGSIVLKKA